MNSGQDLIVNFDTGAKTSFS